MSREELFEKIANLLKGHGVRKVAVFGSYVRGEEKPESDIDILWSFQKEKAFFNS